MDITRVALACAVFLVVGCKAANPLDGPCDPGRMASLRQAVGGVDPADRGTLTSVALGEACGQKLPSGITAMLSKLSLYGVADRATIIAGALGENTAFANGGCPDWVAASSKALLNPPEKRPSALFAACNYQKLGLFTEAELVKSWQASGTALVAAPMYAWLLDNGMDPAEAKRLGRDMFLGDEPPPPPVQPPPPVAPASP